jgi:L-ribulose-5-phosphate 4-epimerase
LKQQVCDANLDLARSGLVLGTFGNVSGIDRDRGLVAIKPSGVPYDRLRPGDIVVVSLKTGRTVEGRRGQLRPSSDLPTHLELYRAFAGVGGIVHTHSLHATAWAQAGRDIPALGTTHADYFNGPVPCTRNLRPGEIRTDYEQNTGRVIVQRFARIDPLTMPAVLVAGHGPFTWGRSPGDAVHNAILLEYVASLAWMTLGINPAAQPISDVLLEKHFSRKHGAGAYYGQGKK